MHLSQMLLQGFDGAKKVSSFQIDFVRGRVDDRNLTDLVLSDVDHSGSSNHKLGPGVVDRGDVGSRVVPVTREFGRDDGGRGGPE